jgi:hypothetical protein
MIFVPLALSFANDCNPLKANCSPWVTSLKTFTFWFRIRQPVSRDHRGFMKVTVSAD